MFDVEEDGGEEYILAIFPSPLPHLNIGLVFTVFHLHLLFPSNKKTKVEQIIYTCFVSSHNDG